MLLDASPLHYTKPAIPLAKWQNMGRGPDSLELTTGRETPGHRAREAPPAAALVFPADALPSEEINPAGWEGSLMATDEIGDGARGYHSGVFRKESCSTSTWTSISFLESKVVWAVVSHLNLIWDELSTPK